MQVPAPFEYERATSIEHALELLAEPGREARVRWAGADDEAATASPDSNQEVSG